MLSTFVDSPALRPLVTNSAPDTAHVAVCGIALRDSAVVRCGATLVSGHVVVTAAHCVAAGPVPQGVQVVFRTPRGEQRLDVVETRQHPSYDAGRRGVHDVAVLRLATAPDVAPVAFSDGDLRPGTPVELVGFGLTESPDVPPGERRAGAASVGDVDDTTFLLRPSPSLSCGGDSGGAVFRVAGDGRAPVLEGVIVSGDQGCVSFTRAMRLAAYRQGFIDPFVERAEHASAPADDASAGCAVQGVRVGGPAGHGVARVNGPTLALLLAALLVRQVTKRRDPEGPRRRRRSLRPT